ncbi:MAG: hypothetical protein ACF8AM_05975 [Rhodopirellula sp. JB055]|uniref:hypothetical protein n=1 Tax=Rhodopirellula sp. JB055 TaxID=3342846 RepID=UPI00370A55FC
MKTLNLLLSLTMALALIGCGSPDQSASDSSSANSSAEDHGHDHADHDHEGHDHDHGESGHPESFAEAIEQINDMGNKITSAFAEGEPDNAHGELHDIGHLIESLPDLAKKAGLPEPKLEKVGEVTETLMDAFGELDHTLHGGEKADVEKISSTISTQMEELQGML